MAVQGMTIDAAAGSKTVVVARKQQLPHVDQASGGPVSGPLPVYVLTAALTRNVNTHVRASVSVDCPSCDGATAYVWEYPADLLRRVLEDTRGTLKERGARLALPPRYAPPKPAPRRRRP